MFPDELGVNAGGSYDAVVVPLAESVLAFDRQLMLQNDEEEQSHGYKRQQ